MPVTKFPEVYFSECFVFWKPSDKRKFSNFHLISKTFVLNLYDHHYESWKRAFLHEFPKIHFDLFLVECLKFDKKIDFHAIFTLPVSKNSCQFFFFKSQFPSKVILDKLSFQNNLVETNFLRLQSSFIGFILFKNFRS